MDNVISLSDHPSVEKNNNYVGAAKCIIGRDAEMVYIDHWLVSRVKDHGAYIASTHPQFEQRFSPENDFFDILSIVLLEFLQRKVVATDDRFIECLGALVAEYLRSQRKYWAEKQKVSEWLTVSYIVSGNQDHLVLQCDGSNADVRVIAFRRVGDFLILK